MTSSLFSFSRRLLLPGGGSEPTGFCGQMSQGRVHKDTTVWGTVLAQQTASTSKRGDQSSPQPPTAHSPASSRGAVHPSEVRREVEAGHGQELDGHRRSAKPATGQPHRPCAQHTTRKAGTGLLCLPQARKRIPRSHSWLRSHSWPRPLNSPAGVPPRSASGYLTDADTGATPPKYSHLVARSLGR